MALIATYGDVLSRVHLAADALGATASYAVFDRTIDGGVHWTTIRGGTSVAVSAQLASLDDYEFPAEQATTYRVRSYTAGGALLQTYTTAYTPTLSGQVWLKSLARPFLNREVWVMDVSDVEREARNGVFPIVGRSLPIAISDVRLGREFTLNILRETAEDADDLDYLLASGDTLFLHAPPDFPVPSLYAVAGRTTKAHPVKGDPLRTYAVPMLECVAPGPDVAGSIGTWQTVINTYATWSDLIAAKATWADVLTLIGEPSEVIVP